LKNISPPNQSHGAANMQKKALQTLMTV